jgi:hypothetical protein
MPRMADNILNVVILLLKLESKQFHHFQELAWQREDVLMDKGMKLMEECFETMNVRDYQMSLVTMEDG